MKHPSISRPKKSSYSDLLRNPKWQRKRLEILQRDEFTCTICEETEKQLHVHHGYYEFGKFPWDYPSKSLHTLCEKCHKTWQGNSKILKAQIGLLGCYDFTSVCGYVAGLRLRDEEIKRIYAVDPMMIEGVSRAVNISEEEIIDNLDGGYFYYEKYHDIKKRQIKERRKIRELKEKTNG